MIPDEIIEIPISDICSCGGKIILSDPGVHQKVDIPEIKPHVKEYHLQRGHCSRCGKKISAKLPDEIGYDLFGFRTKAIISALTGFFKNSKRETTKIMNNIFNLKISLGTISNTEKRVSNKCQNTYQKIKDEIIDEKILHLDETSHYNRGKLGWCWMATNNRTSFIKLADSRAKKVLTEIIPEYDGTVITDRYAAYNYFPKENRQICLAHLARDFERFANSTNIEVRIVGIYLRNMIKELFAIKKAFQTNKISKSIFNRRARKLRKCTLYYLKAITGIPDATRAVSVAKNILKSETMMWKFLEEPNLIPLTNNHAERQIRHYVVYRKNSYFTWSKRGNEFLERIISIYLTWTQRKENPFQYLLLTLNSS